jgi:uncharacterized protein with FMN-binding domain
MCGLTGAVLVASFSRSTHLGTLSGAPAATPGVLVPSSAPATPRATTPAARRASARAAAPRRARHAAATRASSSPRPKPAPKPTVAPSVVVNGQSVDTRYGPVQVQITIRSHRIIKATAIDYPQGSSTDRQINDYAIPQLDDETLQAQSAQIDSVSGATYTSDGYTTSLQSALDSASAAGVW